MQCPFCRSSKSSVVDTRTSDDGNTIRRRRVCQACGKRFSTVETAGLVVVKRSGVVEPFSREKIIAGVRRACQGRPVSDDELAVLAHRVEDDIRSSGLSEIDTQDVGRAILKPLKELDLIAYLRFASVYLSFETLDDFQRAIDELRLDGSAPEA